MSVLRPAEKAYWKKYLDSIAVGLRPLEARIHASMAGSSELADHLLNLYLSGKKTAGSSILEDFLVSGDPLPEPGDFWIVLNRREEPAAILRTTKVLVRRFYEVPEEVARAEGEGDLSLEFWRKEHERFFQPFLPRLGISSIADANIVTEFFERVY